MSNVQPGLKRFLFASINYYSSCRLERRIVLRENSRFFLDSCQNLFPIILRVYDADCTFHIQECQRYFREKLPCDSRNVASMRRACVKTAITRISNSRRRECTRRTYSIGLEDNVKNRFLAREIRYFGY